MLGIAWLIIMNRPKLSLADPTLATDRTEPGPVLTSQVPVTIPGVNSHGAFLPGVCPPPDSDSVPQPCGVALRCGYNAERKEAKDPAKRRAQEKSRDCCRTALDSTIAQLLCDIL